MNALRRCALLLVVLGLVACGELPTDEVAAAPEDGCGPVERPPQQAGSHLIGDAEPPVPYSSTPPTSGWHHSGALEVRIHAPDDPLTEPEQVSVLEMEGVVITYNDIPDADRERIEELVRSEYDGQVSVTPYDGIPSGELAMTAWGVLQRCGSLDLAAVESFIDEHLGDEVAPKH